MAWALHIYIIDATDEEIHAEIVFYGRSKQDCADDRAEFTAACAILQVAEAEGRTDDRYDEIAAGDMPQLAEEPDEEDDVIDVEAEEGS